MWNNFQKMNPNRSLGALPQKLLDDIDEYIHMKSKHNADIPLDTFRKSLYWKGLFLLICWSDLLKIVASCV